MLTKKIACPSCGAGLKIADTLPAGKRITCPKCGVGFGVPANETSPPTSPRSELRSPRREASRRVRSLRPEEPPEDNEDLDEAAEPPVVRKKRRRKRKPARNPALILGLVLGGFVVLIAGGIALAVVFWPFGNKGQVVAGNDLSPAGPAGKAATGESGSTAIVPAQFAAGRKVFDMQCARCHGIGEGSAGGFGGPRGGPGMARMRGPDLGTIGRDPSHTVDWLMEQIRNPKAHKSDSRMPAFEGKINDADLRALAEYLASLK